MMRFYIRCKSKILEAPNVKRAWELVTNDLWFVLMGVVRVATGRTIPNPPGDDLPPEALVDLRDSIHLLSEAIESLNTLASDWSIAEFPKQISALRDECAIALCDKDASPVTRMFAHLVAELKVLVPIELSATKLFRPDDLSTSDAEHLFGELRDKFESHLIGYFDR